MWTGMLGQPKRQTAPRMGSSGETWIYGRKIRNSFLSHKKDLVRKRGDVHVPLGLERIGSCTFLAASEIKTTKASFGSPSHQLPVHEIVRSQAGRLRAGAGIVRQDRVPKQERENSADGFLIQIHHEQIDLARKFLDQVGEEGLGEHGRSQAFQA